MRSNESEISKQYSFIQFFMPSIDIETDAMQADRNKLGTNPGAQKKAEWSSSLM